MEFLVFRNIPLKENVNLLYVNTLTEQPYIPVPASYNAKKWPDKTNMPCYMCTIVTNRRPFFVPTNISTTGKIYRCQNPVVCSPACGMRWAVQNSTGGPSILRGYVDRMIALVFQMTGQIIKTINIAEDRITLIKYTGKSTEHEFQRELITSSGDYIKYLYSSQSDYEYDLS